ncbi:MAG: beta-ketoacyl-ACP synthase II, partial [Kordiimonadaceae bacterium]|nr:beta-ketoacyl-ACP synthase II [Kordiimonadaceae bacterium]
AIFCIKAINEGIIPPTLNLHDLAEGCEGIDLVPLVAQERKITTALSNSFGFGGTNASLVMTEFK